MRNLLYTLLLGFRQIKIQALLIFVQILASHPDPWEEPVLHTKPVYAHKKRKLVCGKGIPIYKCFSGLYQQLSFHLKCFPDSVVPEENVSAK